MSGHLVTTLAIRQASGAAELELARALFRDYADGLGFDLAYQGFAAELAALPGKYAPPAGRLLLAWFADEAAGIVALRALEAGVAEMKRLYVRPAWRGQGIGEALVECLIAEARAAGYRAMRLDTVAGKMERAMALYRARGFVEIAPYYASPIAGTRYMELALEPGRGTAARGGTK